MQESMERHLQIRNFSTTVFTGNCFPWKSLAAFFAYAEMTLNFMFWFFKMQDKKKDREYR